MAKELSPAHRVQWELYDPAFRAKLLDQWRCSAVDDDWWSGVYDQCVEENAALGLEVDKDHIHFTGFSSQGDGACFNAEVVGWEQFLTAAGLPQLWPVVRSYSIDNPHADALSFKVYFGGGHYYHEYMARCSSELYLRGRWTTTEELTEGAVHPLQYAAWNQFTENGFVLMNKEDHLLEFCRTRMKKLYRDLESLHDELTGEVAIIEDILDMYSAEELVERQRKFLRETV
jgi:hypothetical protein